MVKQENEVIEGSEGCYLSLDNFAQSTTFHGVKYFLQYNTTTYRRISWLIAWLFSAVLLSLFIKQKLDLYYTYPSKVDIWDEHISNLSFPAVTLCNKNLHRLSEAHKLGFYDILRMAEDFIKDYEGYFYNESVCTEHLTARFNFTMNFTSISVCQRLCNDSSQCNGFYWYTFEKRCLLTSHTGIHEAQNCTEKNTYMTMMYFRKVRYLHTKPIYCTFDDTVATGACPLLPDRQYDFEFKRLYYEFYEDVTIGFGGKVFGISVKYLDSFQPFAGFMTPLMNTTGKCLLFFYNQVVTYHQFTILQLSILPENLENETNYTLQFNATSEKSWQPKFFILPPGIHRIKFTIFADGFSDPTFIDDLSVRPCHDFKRECLLSAFGYEYMGNLSHSAFADECSTWNKANETVEYLNRRDLHTMNQLYNSPWSSAAYCRHPFDYKTGSVLECPRGDNFVRCKVPHCTCATGWTKCKNGHCIPSRLIINSYRVDANILQKAKELCNGSSPLTHYEGYKRQYLFPLQFPGRPDEDPSLDDDSTWQDIFVSNKNYTLQKLLSINKMNMSSFIIALSHKRENLLLRCQWEKHENCEQFKGRFTDMGLCYTFNRNALKIYKTDKVGERASGIFLVINLASYEAVRSTDKTGLKIMFFDPLEDEELMWEQGIHLMPGSYVSIGITTEAVNYLEQPYGKCGSKIFNHTSDLTYSHSRCIRDHQTTDCISRHGCRDYFMPGKATECDIKQCLTNCYQTMTSYASSCPSHCKATIYHTMLSYSHLSLSDFAETITSEQLAELRNHLAEAREIQSRVDDKKVIEFHDSVNNISHALSIAVKFVQDFLLPKRVAYVHDLSIFFTIPPTCPCKNYLGTVADIHLQVAFYSSIYNKHKNLFAEYLTSVDKFKSELMEIGYILNKLNSNLFSDILALLRLKIQIAQIQIPLMEYNIMQIDNILIPDRENPLNVSECYVHKIKDTKCGTALLQLHEKAKEFVHSMNYIVSFVNALIERDEVNKQRYYSDNIYIIKKYANNSAWLNEIIDFSHRRKLLSECIIQYGTVVNRLSEVTNITPQLFEFPNNTYTDQLIDISIKHRLEQAQRNVENILHSYIKNSITKTTASGKLLNVLKVILSSIEQIKYILTGQIRNIWPEIAQISINQTVNNYREIVHTLRSFHLICLKSPVSQKSLAEFIMYNSNEPHLCDETYHTLSGWLQELAELIMATDNDTITLNNGTTVIVNEFLQQHCVYEAAREMASYLERQLESWLADLNLLKESLYSIQRQISAYNDTLLIDNSYLRQNIILVKIFFTELKVKRMEQSVAYNLYSFFSDLGGSLGLLLGASILSLMEVVDFGIYALFNRFKN